MALAKVISVTFLYSLSLDIMVTISDSSEINLKIGFIFPSVRNAPSAKTAFKIGLENAEHYLSGSRINISFGMGDTKCNPKHGVEAVIKLQKKLQGLDGIIGSHCSKVCKPVGLITAAWNIPQVAYFCTSIELSDRKTYPTFTRTRINIFAMARVIHAVLSIFKWNRYSIVTTDVKHYQRSAEFLQKLSEKSGMDAQIYSFSATVTGNQLDSSNLEILRSIVRTVRHSSRVTVVNMYEEDLRNFLILAKQEGLTDESHAFIGLDSAYRGSRVEARLIEPNLSDTELYQGIIAVTEDAVPDTPVWHNFYNKMLVLMSSNNVSQERIDSFKNEDKQSAGEHKFDLMTEKYL